MRSCCSTTRSSTARRSARAGQRVRHAGELQRLDAGAWFEPAFAGTRRADLAPRRWPTARSLGMALLVEIKERQRADRADRPARRGAGGDGRGRRRARHLLRPPLAACGSQARIPRSRTEIITHARHVDIAAVAWRAGAASVAIEWDMFHPERCTGAARRRHRDPRHDPASRAHRAASRLWPGPARRASTTRCAQG